MDADQPHMKRFLCSDIVVLNIAGKERFVNLEEIWGAGAIVDSEENVTLPASGELKTGSASLNVSIERIEKHKFGYLIEIRFVDAEWTPQLFTPAHLTDLTAIAERARTRTEDGPADG